MSDFATAGGHWYKLDGSPFYTITGANGKERAVTLRDARKVGAVPSVTGIIRCAAAPQLEAWKRKQLALACLTLPRIEGESADDFMVRAERDSMQEGRAAADRGTAIHAAIERHYRGEMPDADYWPWVKVARDVIAETCGEQQWSAERSFAHPLGYGGKTDLHSPEWVVDVKTKDGDLVDAPNGNKLYDEHTMQLAAYRLGLGLPLTARCGILFVGRVKPVACFVEASADELLRGSRMFSALLAYWQTKNNYIPGALSEAA